MPIICPTITAYSEEEYKQQFEKIKHLVHRVQIDLTDGKFTDKATVLPNQAWWPAGFLADFHIMYEQPLVAVKEVIKHTPHLIIVQAEAEGNFDEVAAICRHHKVKVGVALLPQTPVEQIRSSLSALDHVLIFSGHLGHQGGSHADLSLLDKVIELKKLKPQLEVGWDGGVNDQNIAELASAGADVINIGSYIQNADDPARAISVLQRIADETGET